MKNIIILFIILLLTISTTGCELRKSNQNNQKSEEKNNTSQKKESKIKQEELVKKIEAANLGYYFGEGISSYGDVGIVATGEELAPMIDLGVKQKYMESMYFNSMFFSFDNEDVTPQIEKAEKYLINTIRIVTEEGANWTKQEIEFIKNNPSEEYELSKDFDNFAIEFNYTVTQLFVTVYFK